jgi:parallel beta-helix repeat protein
MTVYYVSPTGNDASSGTSVNSAFATLSAAIKAMATGGTADTTYVLDGTYYLNGTALSLTSANSNDTIAAYQGAKPVISGGTPVSASGWTVGANGIWSIQVNSNDVGQLVVNGESQTLARYPNEVPSDPIHGGWLWAQPLPAGLSASNHLAYNPADFPAGQQPVVGDKVTVYDAGDWSSSVLTIGAVDTTTHVITFNQWDWFNIGPGSRYFVSGSQAKLDQPGEWYFNQASHTLYYKAPAGFTGSGAVVSGDMSLLNIANAQNVTIQGLKFSDAATNASVDYITTAAINVSSSSGVVIDGNDFKNVAQGVMLSGTSNHNTVSNNTFSHTWAAAIEVGQGTSQNLITYNSIQDSNAVFATSGAIELENTWNNTISHNSIQNVPRFGIADFQTSGASGANLIEYNTIVNAGLTTNDLGAIYAYAGSNTSALGDSIGYNTIINPTSLGTNSTGFISGGDYWSVGIYMDSGTSNEKIYGNVIHGGTVGGIYLSGGDNNQVWDNIVTGTHQAAGGGLGFGILLGGFAVTTPMMGTQVHNNIIQVPTGASAIYLQTGIVDPAGIYQNIYYSPSGANPQIANKTFSQWQALGGDVGSSVTTNPGFVDAGNNNYQLTAGSYALTHGFPDLPWTQMALAGVQGQTAPVAPGAPVIASFSTDSGALGDHITNDNTLTLAGMAQAGSTVKVYDGGTLLGSTSANGSGAWSYTTAALTNGGHNLTATATDAVGNTGAASTALSVTIDTSAPSAPAIASFSTDSGVTGDHITNDKTLTLAGTAEAGSTVKVYDGATLLGSANANGSGAWSYTTGPLADGSHNLTATATDTAGNTGVASSTFGVTVDTNAPLAPSIGSGVVVNVNAVALSGTAEAGSTVRVYEGTTLVGSATANGSGAWNYTSAALADGGHSFTATATDAAANLGVASSALAVTIDTSTPSPAEDPITVRLSGDAYNGLPQFRLLVDGVQIGATQTVSANHSLGQWDTFIFDLASSPQSEVKVEFLNDAWGGSADKDRNLYVDSIDINGVILTPQDAIYDRATMPDIQGQSKLAWTGALVFDVAGLVAIGGTGTLAVPTITSFSTDSGLAGDHITNDKTLTLTGMAAAGSPVKVYDGANLLGNATANTSGAWNYTTSPLSDGGHNLTATATDAAGKTSAASSVMAVTIDTKAPGAPSIASFSTDSGVVGDHITNDNTLTLAGTAEAGSTVKIYDGTTLLGSNLANGSGAWTYTTAALADGGHNLTATATDAAGNTGTASSALAVTIDTSTPITADPTNTIAVHLSGDAYNGLPQFRLMVDGAQVGATQSVSANHSLAQWQTFNFDLASVPLSEVKVEFLNDAWGGSAATDRNLYVDSIDINGVKLLPQDAIYDRYTMSTDLPGQTNLLWTGALVFDVHSSHLV